MGNKFRSIVSGHIYVFAVIVTTLFLLWLNHEPNTYLIGWDNLQTDLNPILGIKRAFFSVWQEYQSFGLLAGMAHGADLPRSIIVYVFSLFLPQSIIRYIIHSVFIEIGVVGTYFFSQYILKTHKKVGGNNLVSLISGLFYFLNFGSVQILGLPFESFTIFFGLLPWMLLYFIKILNRRGKYTKSDLFKFVFVNIVGMSSFVSQQLFIVYAIILFFAVLTIPSNNFIRKIKMGFILGVIVLCINSSWLFPQAYFVTTSSDVVTESKINQLATEDVKYLNKDMGTYTDFVFMRGLFLESRTIDGNRIFNDWEEYQKNVYLQFVIYALFSILIVGLFSKNRFRLFFIALYFVFGLFLISIRPPFEQLQWIIEKIPIVNQMFRSPFTKWIIPYSLISSLCLAIGVQYVLNRLRVSILRYIFVGTVISGIVVVSFPIINKKLFAKELQTPIPKEYLEVISFFNKEPKNARIALLPEYTFWGWYKTLWGFNGSGFLWYAIEQPIISRTFDVWSSSSERYYLEIRRSIETKNTQLFFEILKKYRVDYLVVDSSLIPLLGHPKGLLNTQVSEMLSNGTEFNLAYIGDYVKIYKRDKIEDSFLTTSSTYPNMLPSPKYWDVDPMFEKYGAYISNSHSDPDFYFPFAGFFSDSRDSEKFWMIKESAKSFLLSVPIEAELRNRLPVVSEKFQIFLSEVETNRSNETKLSYWIEDNTFFVEIPKVLAIDLLNYLESCSNTYATYKKLEGGVIRLDSKKGSSSCTKKVFSDLSRKNAFVLSVDTDKIFGRASELVIQDYTNKSVILNTRLEDGRHHIFIPKGATDSLGFEIIFDSDGYKNIASQNDISSARLYYFPVNEIQDIHFVYENTLLSNTVSKSIIPDQKSTFRYQFKAINSNSSSLIALDQSFHPGWIAARSDSLFSPFFGERLEHVTVNGWANGWILPEECDIECPITIVFWPQYLQYAGYLPLIVSMILGGFVLTRSKNKTK